MKATTIWIGMDVHKKTIALCWLRGDSQVEEEREIPNNPGAVRTFFKRLRKEGELRACYEAGPCGYDVRRQLDAMKVPCDVIAPSMIPRRPGDRVKTDRRDARKLARMLRAGELTAIRVPTEKEEAVRDLVRCREDVAEDLRQKRQQLLGFLLKHGRIWTLTRNWSQRHWAWLRGQTFVESASQRAFLEYVAELDFAIDRVSALDRELAEIAEQEPWKPWVDRLRCLRGIDVLSALTLVVEIGDFRRFRPRELMAFVGLVPSIHSSGESERRGAITKAGNTHVRRVLVEAAWHNRHLPQRAEAIRKRVAGMPDEVYAEAAKAQHRLHARYRRLVGRGKPSTVAATAVARELVGFIWALMVDPKSREPKSASPGRVFTLQGRGLRKTA